MLNGKCICALLIAFFAGATYLHAQDSPLAVGAVLTVTGHGTDRTGSICDGFNLTTAQAKEFFRKSHRISQKVLHDHYDYLPCWVEGTMTREGETMKWKIRPIGIGEIHRPDGTVELRGCKTCDNLFK